MATATTLVLKNAAAVNVNYFPIKIVTGEAAIYVDRTNSALSLQSRASMFFKETSTVRKVSGKVSYPVANATTGLLSHTMLGTFELVLPLQASLADRQEARARLAAMVADAIVTAACDNGETPW